MMTDVKKEFWLKYEKSDNKQKVKMLKTLKRLNFIENIDYTIIRILIDDIIEFKNNNDLY